MPNVNWDRPEAVPRVLATYPSIHVTRRNRRTGKNIQAPGNDGGVEIVMKKNKGNAPKGMRLYVRMYVEKKRQRQRERRRVCVNFVCFYVSVLQIITTLTYKVIQKITQTYYIA